MRISYLIPGLAILISSCNKPDEPVDCEVPAELVETVPCAPTDTAADVNGFTVIYYPGTTDKQSEGNFENGVYHGFWKFYFPNGELVREGNYLEGRADGFWNVYYENGHIRSQGQFEDCERSGFWKYYYEDNDYAVEYEGNYTSGNKTGIWKKYNLEGSLDHEFDCD